MSKIEKLRLDEAIRLDQTHVIALYAELGPQGAEQLLACAMEDMAVHISTMSRAAERKAPDRVIITGEKLVKLAVPLGMDAIAAVARDVIACAQAEDQVGLAATLNRLIRIGDRALTAIWDSGDLIG